jgi:hypothetical protein
MSAISVEISWELNNGSVTHFRLFGSFPLSSAERSYYEIRWNSEQNCKAKDGNSDTCNK